MSPGYTNVRLAICVRGASAVVMSETRFRFGIDADRNGADRDGADSRAAVAEVSA